MNINIILSGLALLAGFSLTPFAAASGTSPAQMQSSNDVQSQPEMSLYDQGLQSSKSNDFQKAKDLFQQALTQDPYNPDILNMLAHSERKLGQIDDAIAHYQKALQIRPNFPEAREYLGETYLQAALQQLDILKTYGDSAKEEIEDLSEDIQTAVKKIAS